MFICDVPRLVPTRHSDENRPVDWRPQINELRRYPITFAPSIGALERGPPKNIELQALHTDPYQRFFRRSAHHLNRSAMVFSKPKALGL